MSTAAMITTPLFAVFGVITAIGIGHRLKGQGIWRFIGIMACLGTALRAPDIAIGLFG